MALSALLQALKEADIRICSFDTTNTQWRFVFRQHDVARGVQIVQEHASSVAYEYHASMLSFIGCRDIDYLHSQLGAKAPLKACSTNRLHPSTCCPTAWTSLACSTK